MSKTLATLPLGTGCAKEIRNLFDNVIQWSPGAKYDAIVFEGGSDIHPSLYNNPNTDIFVGDTPSNRDRIELGAFKHAVDQGALVIGVCRGAQLACALAGGKLVQNGDYYLLDDNVYTGIVCIVSPVIGSLITISESI